MGNFYPIILPGVVLLAEDVWLEKCGIGGGAVVDVVVTGCCSAPRIVVRSTRSPLVPSHNQLSIRRFAQNGGIAGQEQSKKYINIVFEHLCFLSQAFISGYTEAMNPKIEENCGSKRSIS